MLKEIGHAGTGIDPKYALDEKTRTALAASLKNIQHIAENRCIIINSDSVENLCPNSAYDGDLSEDSSKQYTDTVNRILEID